jgi:hypothetical protein
VSDAPQTSSASTERNVLTAADRTKQRNEAATELVKALLIINGGGAVALLAFLQAIWVDSHDLAKPTVIGIAFLSFGAAAAAAFHIFRHQASWHHQSGSEDDWVKFRCLYLVSASVSLIAFVVGVSIIVAGVLSAV